MHLPGRKPSALDEPTGTAEPVLDDDIDALVGCEVSIDVQQDSGFHQAYDADPVVATCAKCGLSSTPRTSEEKARAELAHLCAERLAPEADAED
jgi:hypothetical protein